MKALHIGHHTTPSLHLGAEGRAVFTFIGKLGFALIVAFLLGALVPTGTDGWTLPTEPAVAATFTA